MVGNGSGSKKISREKNNCCVPQCSEAKADENQMYWDLHDQKECQKWAAVIKTDNIDTLQQTELNVLGSVQDLFRTSRSIEI